MVTIVNKHHIRKIDSKIMIILCFASFTIDGTVTLSQCNLIQSSTHCPSGLRYTTPTNPHKTGNLRKIMSVKINARVMITTNIDVTDGLKNGAVGTVTNVVIDEKRGKMSAILVSFDSKHVGQEAVHTSVHKSTNQNAVTIYQTQTTFPIHKKNIISSNKKSVSTKTCLGCYNTQMSRTDTT